MQFTKCHTTAMSFSVLESIFPVWIQMLVPMSQATTQAFQCAASLRFLGWNWLSRVEMQQGMVGGRVGFLVAGLWQGVRGIIEKVIFRPAIFLHVAVQCRFTSLLALWRFCFFRVLGGLAHHKLRHYDQDERQPDGSRHWDFNKPVLMKAFAQKRSSRL